MPTKLLENSGEITPERMKRKNQSAWGWCTGMTQRDVVGRQVGRGFMFGNACKKKKIKIKEPKQKQHPVVDVTDDRSKVWSCKEQYCIGTWNVRSMN